VYTNPLPNTTISHRDRAFVLGIDIPNELQGDMYETVEKDKEVLIGKRGDEHMNAEPRSTAKSRKEGKQDGGGSKMNKG